MNRFEMFMYIINHPFWFGIRLKYCILFALSILIMTIINVYQLIALLMK